MINKDGRISPAISLAVLILFSIGLDVAMFVGMLYLFENETRDDAINTALDKRSVQLAQRIEHLAAQNVELNERQIAIQEQQGNLTLPQINEQFQIHKEQVAKHDQSLKDAVKIAISNFSKILENQQIILERIDNNTVVSNTTVTAIN